MKKILIIIALFSLFGCKKEQYKEANVPVYIPSVFSPDGDGVNDFFGPIFDYQGFPVAEYRMMIETTDNFKIFETNNYKDMWTGINLKTKIAYPAGAYKFHIFIRFSDNGEFKHDGKIDIIDFQQ
ncbi:MAG: gliding motility-associated C-terminal domain-containing protein [Bacteroidota bacterium]